MGTRAAGSSGPSSSPDGQPSLTTSTSRPRLRVLYDFEYETRGKRVRIVKDERLLLLGKTNEDWWQVVRPGDLTDCFYVPEQRTFYVPTGYVHELPELQLHESTRFYVDKDRMFKSNESGSPMGQQPSQPSQQHSKDNDKEEPRKAHDSFRSVIRKLSGNLGDGSKSGKAGKPSKVVKSLRKNSVESGEEVNTKGLSKASLVPSKHKDMWDGSAFGMCFGRDGKNVDAQVLNPFQEELENALSNRVTQKRTILDTKALGVGAGGKHVDQVFDDREKASKFESIQHKWERVSAQVLKKQENLPLSKIKEDVQKAPIVPGKSEVANNKKPEVKRSSETDKLLYSMVEKNPKKLPDQKPEVSGGGNKPVVDTVVPATTIVPPEQDIDRLLINDKRKMWAIETLMSELMQSSTNSKAAALTDSRETVISGPNQLAQELHDMSVSRRFENAEIQVNLLDNNENENSTKEKTNGKSDMESWKRKVFDFPPSMAKVPRSPTARSPKLLDEYNEANILSDHGGLRGVMQQDGGADRSSWNESPSYSNISQRIKREQVPCKLKMPTRDFREELQLTPSLEKLASEIRFLPASANSMEFENEKHSLDMGEYLVQ